MSLTPLEARITVAKKARESSTRVKDSSKTRTASPKVDKCNFTEDVCVYDLLMTNFLSSQSACIKLVHHIHQLSDLEKKNVDLTGKLSAEQISHETRMSEMNESIDARKPSFVTSDMTRSYDKLLAKLKPYHKATWQSKFEVVIEAYSWVSLTARVGSFPIIPLKMKMLRRSTLTCSLLKRRKETFFRHECKNANMTRSYDKLLAKLKPYHKATWKSKFEVVIEAYSWVILTARVGSFLVIPLKMKMLRRSTLTCSLLKVSKSMRWI
ncbi:unnamed protein product [Prunus armeniaca]